MTEYIERCPLCDRQMKVKQSCGMYFMQCSCSRANDLKHCMNARREWTVQEWNDYVQAERGKVEDHYYVVRRSDGMYWSGRKSSWESSLNGATIFKSQSTASAIMRNASSMGVKAEAVRIMIFEG